FGIWTYSQEEFDTFLEILNSHHTAIKVTHNIQKEKIEFLDTQVFFRILGGGRKGLATRVFFKDTDRHALLHKTSFHPKHTFRGIIKSQLTRFHRICTFPKDVEEATQTLFRVLRTRGYAGRFLREVKREVAQNHNINQFHVKTNDQQSIIPFVHTFSHHSGNINRDFRKHFLQAQECSVKLAKFKSIMAYRKNKNLRDILVHAEIKNNDKYKREQTYLLQTKFLKNNYSGRGTPVEQVLDLDTDNVVYAIRCKECQKLYIGETKNKLVYRLRQHLYYIRQNKKGSILYDHFREHGCEKLQIQGVESKLEWTTQQRRKVERRWIKTLETLEPVGLNER
ncbi:MAG: GIY-YIG nuclease family protein, partial [Cetobacterium sp.]|uniref:GIY-YIG nuclease family protein n=1 Tax=Cetobacterium sp. TaxID=2071632 RepID=UPI003F39C6F7